jgi:hypothetical protein
VRPGGAQTHDFNPGLDNGLFWTKRIPNDSVEVDLEHHKATLRVSDIDLEDYHNAGNALQDGPSKPAIASYTVRWSGGKETHVHDDKQQFRGTYSLGKATVEWSAEEAGLSYRSDPASTSETEFALLGRERNGVFFSPTKGCEDC